MKSALLYPHGGGLTGRACCRLHAKHAAYSSALYTLHISILVVLLYIWRLGVNFRKFGDLEDVYYGVQIAYIAIIGTQTFMVFLSCLLFYGIYKEKSPLVVPWIIGCITFMALEAMAMVYSNVLRDHVNRLDIRITSSIKQGATLNSFRKMFNEQFDSMCKAEVIFFVCRAVLNGLSIWGVLRFYHLLKAGVTWRDPEAIEL